MTNATPGCMLAAHGATLTMYASLAMDTLYQFLATAGLIAVIIIICYISNRRRKRQKVNLEDVDRKGGRRSFNIIKDSTNSKIQQPGETTEEWTRRVYGITQPYGHGFISNRPSYEISIFLGLAIFSYSIIIMCKEVLHPVLLIPIITSIFLFMPNDYYQRKIVYVAAFFFWLFPLILSGFAGFAASLAFALDVSSSHAASIFAYLVIPTILLLISSIIILYRALRMRRIARAMLDDIQNIESTNTQVSS